MTRITDLLTLYRDLPYEAKVLTGPVVVLIAFVLAGAWVLGGRLHDRRMKAKRREAVRDELEKIHNERMARALKGDAA